MANVRLCPLSVCALGALALTSCEPTTRRAVAHAETTFKPNTTVTLATFNIQVFGPTKASRPEIMAQLGDIVRRYDLVAIQEIRDVHNRVPEILLDALHSADSEPTFDFVTSPRTGRNPDDTASQEQYAYYFNAETIELVDAPLLYDDVDDLFQREPFVARFRSVFGNFSFVMINIHTRPHSAIEEIGALHDVVRWARNNFPAEDDFIVAGDFNASCRYANPEELDRLEFRSAAYHWVVPDDADTNLADSVCAYDRIVFGIESMSDFSGAWGVDQAFVDRAVSDHWPVWASFYDERDEGENTCCRVCVAGKACGDTCIGAHRTCRQAPGCACDG